MSEQTRFTGKTIVVTGGSGGLGWAIANAFSATGGRVIVGDVAAPAQTDNDSISYIPLDVTDENAWISLFDKVDAAYGGLDVLVNSAGFYKPNIPFEEMPLDLWRKHFAINADGAFLGCKHAILRMKGRGEGAVINMGSGLSITANAFGSAYCGSKAAVLMTTRVAAAAAGAYGIRVNAVLPGAVPTSMLMGNMVEGETEEAFLEKMIAYSPLGRLATPEDIARGVLFLADPANVAITGVHLPIDGGNMPGA
ncbi:SDR family NAD(P)-dependent oxidoreductase [Parasphingorhabdus sp.]|uniref:SDR family NAD(P)-dependent oxidoreductase n=1 Tax=Parasphingorhabdus sp. TaxID=2709688 RepID=UPI002F95E891